MSAPLEAAKTSAASPPPPSASPAPAAPKKRAKRAAPSSADGTTAPAPKKAKKAEAATDGNGGVVAAKKAAPKRKPKEAEETEEATVEPKEMAKRLAEIEAEEQDMAGKGLDDENDANSWQDSLIQLNPSATGHYEEQLMTLYATMNPEQQERYARFRASGISEAEFTDEVLKPLGLHASTETTTVMRSIGKLFIGELVDRALTVMEEWGDQGPIRPVHIREAYKRIEDAGQMPKTPSSLRFGKIR